MEKFENETKGGGAEGYSPVLILVLGILGITSCSCLTAIPAWYMGRKTIDAMENRWIPDKDMGLVRAGLVLGQIGTVLGCCSLMLLAVLLPSREREFEPSQSRNPEVQRLLDEQMRKAMEDAERNPSPDPSRSAVPD